MLPVSDNHKRLRGALVGFGNVAVNAHVPLFQQNTHFEIAAVVEPSPERAKLIQGLLPHARIYPHMESLLAENDLDFVDICTPPCFHAELMLASCRAGLHAFCEKPLVTSFDHLLEIKKVADKSGSVIFTVNNWKYAPIWSQALDLIRTNIIGEISSVSLTVLRPPVSGGGATDWRKHPDISGGGILFDHGWHHLYLILSLMNQKPSSIAAAMEYSQENNSSLEETVDVRMRFPRAEGHLYLTWQASHRNNFGTIIGDGGKISINDDHLVVFTDERQPLRYDFPEPLSGGSHHPEWMKPVIENFRNEIFDSTKYGANLLEATWCSHLTHLAYQSHREGSRFISVSEPA